MTASSEKASSQLTGGFFISETLLAIIHAMRDQGLKTIVCRQIDGTTKEAKVEDMTFRPSAYGLVVRDGHILLSPQWDGYDFPGGGIDLGERIEDAVVREVKEETGVEVTCGRLLHVADDFFIRPKSETPVHSILLFYECSYVGGELSTDGFSVWEKDILKIAEWIPLEKVPALKFYNPIDSARLIAAMQNRKI